MKKRVFFMVFAVLALLVSSCSDDTTPAKANLTLNITGLEALGANYVYEGWIIVNGKPVSTGTFNSIATGQIFSVDATQLAAATKFVLTIEPADETGVAAATPAATKLLVGDFSGATANVSIGTVADFSSGAFSGKFFLRSPTDEAAGAGNNGNDQYGIWFGNPGMPPTAAFNLPTLSAGWKYEGWVVDTAGPITTGTFTAFNMKDDNAGPSDFGGPENDGPPIPGEDFFANAPAGFTFPLDIRGKTVVISIEPSPDNSPAPFLLKPLKGTAGNATAPTTYDLAFSNASFPTGSVSR